MNHHHTLTNPKLLYHHFFTINSRRNPFGLIVSLDDVGEATGSMFWDDGDSIGRKCLLIACVMLL
jgi:hypothetical protein